MIGKEFGSDLFHRHCHGDAFYIEYVFIADNPISGLIHPFGHGFVEAFVFSCCVLSLSTHLCVVESIRVKNGPIVAALGTATSSAGGLLLFRRRSANTAHAAG